MDPQLLFGGASLATGLALGWKVVADDRALDRAVAANLDRGLAGHRTPTTGELPQRSLGPILDRVLSRARRFTPAAGVARLEHRIEVAGLRGRWTPERVVATKVGLAAAGAFFGVMWLAASPSLLNGLLAVALPLLGWHGPEIVLRSRMEQRQALLVRELPDVVDRLCVMVEAGLGFERALQRTVQGGGELALELQRVVQEVQLGARRSDALQALADRVDVTELRRVVGSLRQAEQYGVPVSQVLRSEADALRDRQAQLAEERAQKLPVKVLFPLIFCILPALLVVVLGPAMLDVSGGLGG